jgi:hypothetical protein
MLKSTVVWEVEVVCGVDLDFRVIRHTLHMKLNETRQLPGSARIEVSLLLRYDTSSMRNRLPTLLDNVMVTV